MERKEGILDSISSTGTEFRIHPTKTYNGERAIIRVPWHQDSSGQWYPGIIGQTIKIVTIQTVLLAVETNPKDYRGGWSKTWEEDAKLQDPWEHPIPPKPERHFESPTRRSARRRARLKRRKIGIWNRDGGVCQLCQCAVALKDATLDHILPKSKGGNNRTTNLRTAHKSCNERRGNGDPPYTP